jgi:DNA-binding response OmpR family regulator
MAEILLVEDARELAESVRRELMKEGHSVSLALDGEKALETFRSTQPDLVILDWMLPKKDGLSVLRQIRAETNTPVLMLSARGEAMDRVIGLEVGADDYLVKPFSNRELLARVHALLRRMAMIEETIQDDQRSLDKPLVYGSLSLSPETRQVRLNGEVIELSKLEFNLLALLMNNSGRVFSRAYLIETIWDEEYLPGDRSVDNVILRLRQKLGEVGEKIETVWGVGYRLRKTL